MNLVLKQKSLLLPFRSCSEAPPGVGCAGQVQQVRRWGMVSGPPRFRISFAQKALLGWGSMLSMMVIPIWTLYQLPHWSALHNNQKWEEDEQPDAKVEEV